MISDHGSCRDGEENEYSRVTEVIGLHFEVQNKCFDATMLPDFSKNE